MGGDQPQSASILDLECFVSGVPSYATLTLNFGDIADLVKLNLPQAMPLCYIGAVSYAEAFFSDHFAALINICPALVTDLHAAGEDVSISASDLISMRDRIPVSVGFLLSERYDFGSPKKINNLYTRLMKTTPFSTVESHKYNEILVHRNLLVHRGGVYSPKYLKSQSQNTVSPSAPFWDSLVITSAMVLSAMIFLMEVAEKTVRATANAVSKRLEGDSSVQEYQRGALKLMTLEVDRGESLLQELRMLSQPLTKTQANRW